ncbi:MAG: glycosyltransferase family 39 protein, partial [Anaerolineales bacterium]|nr:glycosyltransferase family 39 protein [Anaerolineales bacterium]
MSKIRHQHVLAVMILTLLIAAALRLPTLATIPPGPHYDEAANAILAAEIGIDGKRPIFISSYTGKEVLFFYLAGGVMRVVGESVFSLRITAVFVSLLTIAATYWLGVESTRDKRIALLAAGILAVSFWHLLFSRLGFRAVTQPLLQALTAAALLRGLRREQWRWFIVSGIALGLTAYTYLAARLFPILLLIAALPLLLNRKMRRHRLPQLVLTGTVGLIVLTPLLLYFVRNPDAFWVRIGQVAPDTAVLSIGESYWRSLLMLVWQGDPYIRFNLPDLPLFGWWWSVMLLVGWLVGWRRWRFYKRDWERFVTILLLLTPFFMILPTALATSEIVPSNLRAIGLMPFIFYLPAMG